jgi:sugar/nucleoside kinase (ribokinase family)
MNRDELRRILNERGIRARSYSLDGGSANDRYCIEQSSGGWATFYSERGNRNKERWFSTEDEASQDLLERLLADPTTRH